MSDELLFSPRYDAITREEFQYTNWEGFAVSHDEAGLVQQLLHDSSLRNTFLHLISNGSLIRTDAGAIDPELVRAHSLLGTRTDGINYFVQSLLAGTVPPASQNDRVRNMTTGEGILFTTLAGYKLDPSGKVVLIEDLSPSEVASMLTTAEVYEPDAALIDALYPLLRSEARSDELFMTLLIHSIKTGEKIAPEFLDGFTYNGTQLQEYLHVIAHQRGGVRWGVGRSITQQQGYTFGRGHVPKEIEIKGPHLVIPTHDIDFALVKPLTFEEKLVAACTTLNSS